MDEKDKLKIAIEVLKAIADPISKMRKIAKESGLILDGDWAVRLADNPFYLKEIAQEGLKRLGVS